MRQQKIKLLVAANQPIRDDLLAKLQKSSKLLDVVGLADTTFEATRMVHELQPYVVLMQMDLPASGGIDDGVAATETIVRDLPGTQVVVIAKTSRVEYLRRSMLAGAREFLAPPFSDDELVNTVRRVFRYGKTRTDALNANGVVTGLLPALDSDDPIPDPEPAPNPDPIPQPEPVEAVAQKIKLMILYNNITIVENLRKFLYFEPNIEIAGMGTSLSEVMQLSAKVKPDVLIITSLTKIGTVSGFKAIAMFTEQFPNCPVIVMSISNRADDIRRCLEAGASDFLTKPFTSKSLVDAIYRVSHIEA